MINTAIAGASGYAGIELVKLISNHPAAELISITSNTYKGKALTEIFPGMKGFENLVFEGLTVSGLAGRIDVMFLALPHKVSMQYVPELIEAGIKVIDLSADYRFSDAQLYEAAYQTHTSRHLLAQSVYGLSEIYKDEIKKSDLTGNPGCYPTSILLPLIPLVRENLISTDNIICDSKSGVSGAGRSLSLSTHFCEVNESFNAYKIGNHRHTPEINEILSLNSQTGNIKITFVPHLIPITRGMLSTIYVETHKGVSEDRIRSVYESYYGEHFFINILEPGSFPAVAHVRGTNRCDIGFYHDNAASRLVIVSAIDNLLKGAAGQAVQNMNLMFGLKDTTGLDSVHSPL